jgi:hypothetical protein
MNTLSSFPPPALRPGEPTLVSLGKTPLACCGAITPLMQDMRDSRPGWYKCVCGQRYFVDSRRHTVHRL